MLEREAQRADHRLKVIQTKKSMLIGKPRGQAGRRTNGYNTEQAMGLGDPGHYTRLLVSVLFEAFTLFIFICPDSD